MTDTIGGHFLQFQDYADPLVNVTHLLVSHLRHLWCIFRRRKLYCPRDKNSVRI